MYEIYYTRQASKELDRLDGSVKPIIREAVEELKSFPCVSNLKPMAGMGLDVWRKRVRDWRIIFVVDEGTIEITVIKIGHRSYVYGD